ncbi:hypothetical protein L3X38_041778 [Prunus dulcis]|uniref:Uncharacterized protein n=1 Tax=Prunus dulcis TaxID=3755 RepID=A0AAD4UTL4_PRUDU|nr:hypothetical protein L3X38_041778 [Prunus dulcis]
MMIVASDYCTKWIEAEALSSTKEVNVERFIWRNIICWFGCPQSLVGRPNGKWVDELSKVLWAYRTTKRRSIDETSFSLTYGIEAIIPPHIIVPSISLEVGNVDQNSEKMRLNLDLFKGERENTIILVTSYQQQLKPY